MRTRKLLFFLLILLGGCAQMDNVGAKNAASPTPTFLIFTNKSQFALKEIRIHPEPNYLNAANLLNENLQIENSFVLEYTGDTYVTIIRQKNPLADELIAFTTATPLSLKTGEKYTLKIFDDIFRFIKGEESIPPETQEGNTLELN